jgi:glucose-1-phosphate adenylyltransferase
VTLYSRESTFVHRAHVSDSILLSGVNVGPGARIRRAIVDENVQVMAGASIEFALAETHGLMVSSNGIVVVQANSIVGSPVAVRSILATRHLAFSDAR